MRAAILLVVFLPALVACSAQDLASLYCGSPPPQNNNPVIPQLLYPVPGFTKVPDNAPTMVVAYSQSPASAFPIILTVGSTQIQLPGMKAPPNPLPQPIAKELVPGTPEYGIAMPRLKARTTYAAAYKDTISYCGQSFVNYYNMGSFTTQ